MLLQRKSRPALSTISALPSHRADRGPIATLRRRISSPRAGASSSKKSWRHLKFIPHEPHPNVRTPRGRVPDGAVRQGEPECAGKPSDCALLFAVSIMTLSPQMSCGATTRISGLSAHRAMAIRHCSVEQAAGPADYSEVQRLEKRTLVTWSRRQVDALVTGAHSHAGQAPS